MDSLCRKALLRDRAWSTMSSLWTLSNGRSKLIQYPRLAQSGGYASKANASKPLTDRQKELLSHPGYIPERFIPNSTARHHGAPVHRPLVLNSEVEIAAKAASYNAAVGASKEPAMDSSNLAVKTAKAKPDTHKRSYTTFARTPSPLVFSNPRLCIPDQHSTLQGSPVRLFNTSSQTMLDRFGDMRGSYKKLREKGLLKDKKPRGRSYEPQSAAAGSDMFSRGSDDDDDDNNERDHKSDPFGVLDKEPRGKSQDWDRNGSRDREWPRESSRDRTWDRNEGGRPNEGYRNQVRSQEPDRDRYSNQSRDRYSDQSRDRYSDQSRDRYSDQPRGRYSDQSRDRYSDQSMDRKFSREDSSSPSSYQKPSSGSSWGNKREYDDDIERDSSSSVSLSNEYDYLYSPTVVLPALKNDLRTPKTLYYFRPEYKKRKNPPHDPTLDCISIAREKGISVIKVSKHELNRLSGQRPHQGVVLEATKLDPLAMNKLGEVDENGNYLIIGKKNRSFESQVGEPPVWLALDEVVDPQNLGAILRTAFFMGTNGVVVCQKNSAPLSATVAKASSGALEIRPTYSVRSLMKFIQESQKAGWYVVGAHVTYGSKRNRPIHTWPETGVSQPTLLVLGNEGNGLRKQIMRQCDAFIQIPPLALRESEVDSLNVSVATGIILSKLMGGRFSNIKSVKKHHLRGQRILYQDEPAGNGEDIPDYDDEDEDEDADGDDDADNATGSKYTEEDDGDDSNENGDSNGSDDKTNDKS
ncbi:hypothetical protein BGW38_008475 [Lunasporangiospora selenospora]|uniref:rRNA methyltransferase 1, mitochondrial n=1 Tax=Lunasporangiospora selenospora TaxID=979761 RepID=A0A9P6FYL7_9FUNG|nr:hypothetical protein BGW38_008475 [Lunasporangiospora selenospora]